MLQLLTFFTFNFSWFKRGCMDFSTLNGVIMDMDGVLWRGDEILPGVAQFIEFLRERGVPFALASNNSSKTPADYVAKLESMGVNGVLEHQIVTSGTAACIRAASSYPRTLAAKTSSSLWLRI